LPLESRDVFAQGRFRPLVDSGDVEDRFKPLNPVRQGAVRSRARDGRPPAADGTAGKEAPKPASGKRAPDLGGSACGRAEAVVGSERLGVLLEREERIHIFNRGRPCGASSFPHGGGRAKSGGKRTNPVIASLLCGGQRRGRGASPGRNKRGIFSRHWDQKAVKVRVACNASALKRMEDPCNVRDWQSVPEPTEK